jgi:hypothetical protein
MLAGLALSSQTVCSFLLRVVRDLARHESQTTEAQHGSECVINVMP